MQKTKSQVTQEVAQRLYYPAINRSVVLQLSIKEKYDRLYTSVIKNTRF